MDILVTEVQDKIAQTIKFLQKDGEIESNLTLREAYNKYLHPDVLPLDDMSIWKVIDDAAVLDLFQLDSEIGRQGSKKIRPDSMIELSSVNGLIRLMTTEKGAETGRDRRTPAHKPQQLRHSARTDRLRLLPFFGGRSHRRQPIS